MKSAWEKVKLARLLERPKALDYIHTIFDDFIELHGDREFGDDKAIVGGIATLEGMPVTVIGEQKGKKAKENIERNFGMPEPEGYRKAMRLMNIAYTFLVIYRDYLTYFTAVNYIFKGNKERCITENRAYYNFNIVFLCSFRYFKAFLFCRSYGLFKKNIIF